MSRMITVARMPQTIHYDGKTYGPSEKPLHVPEDLAAALGLQPVSGPLPAALNGADDAQAEELRAARTLAEQAQGNLNGLLEQLAPLAQDGEMPDQVLKRVVADCSRLKKDLDSKTREAQHAVEQWTATTEESSQLQKQLAGAQVIPADARERLIAVKGISDALADAALAALSAPAKSEGE